MNKHIMLDLETFGNKPYSMIIAIGACVFDPNSRSKIEDSFYVTISPEVSEKHGFRMNADTVCWWMLPAQRAAWDDFRGTIHFEPTDAYNGFNQWLDQAIPDKNDRIVWGNGPGFDNELMQDAHRLMNMDAPWSHSNDRCFRTFKNLPRAKGVCPPFVGTQHNALADAMHQATWLQNIVREYELTI